MVLSLKIRHCLPEAGDHPRTQEKCRYVGLALGVHTELTKGSATPRVTSDQMPILSGVSLGDTGHGVSSTLSCLSFSLLPFL